MIKTRYAQAAVLLATLALAACGSSPKPGTAEERAALSDKVQATKNDFMAKDPSIQRFFDTAYGYVVFPNITTGAAVIGGAHGRGQVFQRGTFIGYADVSQASIGAQIGGQTFAEVIFFQDQRTFVNFQQSQLALDARASAVAISSGAAATADYANGVATFTFAQGGLMAQAAVGGQKFRFTPAENATAQEQ